MTASGLVLLYHRVANLTHDVHGLAVRVDDFADHMNYLRRNHTIVPLNELIDCSARGFIPAKAVAVTFDDAYIDNLLTASLVLETFNVPATFFVTTERLDDPGEFWWDTLERMFLCGDLLPAALEIEWRSKPIRSDTGTLAARAETHWMLYRLLYACLPAERDALLARLVSWSGLRLPVRPDHRPMMRDEIRLLSARPGHTIGAHTESHLALPPQTPDVQRDEIRRNKVALEEITGQRVSLFAYPYGDVNPSTAAIAGETFAAAVTCETEPFVPGRDPLRLPRHMVKPSRVSEFAAFMSSHSAASL